MIYGPQHYRYHLAFTIQTVVLLVYMVADPDLVGGNIGRVLIAAVLVGSVFNSGKVALGMLKRRRATPQIDGVTLQ